MQTLNEILRISASRHTHLCPRQVLGARIGLAGASALGLDLPRRNKRLFIIILETDGCFADGIEAATACTVGHRTLRIEDYGKIAATFVDVETEDALRIAPQPDLRQRAFAYVDGESRHYFAQLQAYQSMPEDELLTIQPVILTTPIQAIVSRAGVRVNCEMCGEEIINEREVLLHGRVLCHACAHGGYYVSVEQTLPQVELSRSCVELVEG
ncbi:MAG: TraR/DksA C4-type zinc finger protein [Chloroflexi bacterium]|nr:TraR/DksA C4-type zinc finger protein [Chloroflexota bacterium]